jgi:hypothetical protein
MTQSRPGSPPPECPPREPHHLSTPAPVADPAPKETGLANEWWPYAMFGGITLLIGCLALLVVALSR